MQRSSKPKKIKVTEVWCTSEVKLNKNYNSSGASVGMKAVVEEDEDPNEVLRILKKKVKSSLDVEIEKIVAFLEKASD
jgi:uncharacterized membrane protein YcjF (UPF0283 family)